MRLSFLHIDCHSNPYQLIPLNDCLVLMKTNLILLTFWTLFTMKSINCGIATGRLRTHVVSVLDMLFHKKSLVIQTAQRMICRSSYYLHLTFNWRQAVSQASKASYHQLPGAYYKHCNSKFFIKLFLNYIQIPGGSWPK